MSLGQSLCSKLCDILVPIKNILRNTGDNTHWNVLTFNYNSFVYVNRFDAVLTILRQSQLSMLKIIEKLEIFSPSLGAFKEIGSTLSRLSTVRTSFGCNSLLKVHHQRNITHNVPPPVYKTVAFPGTVYLKPQLICVSFVGKRR